MAAGGDGGDVSPRQDGVAYSLGHGTIRLPLFPPGAVGRRRHQRAFHPGL